MTEAFFAEHYYTILVVFALVKTLFAIGIDIIRTKRK